MTVPSCMRTHPIAYLEASLQMVNSPPSAGKAKIGVCRELMFKVLKGSFIAIFPLKFSCLSHLVHER